MSVNIIKNEYVSFIYKIDNIKNIKLYKKYIIKTTRNDRSFPRFF